MSARYRLVHFVPDPFLGGRVPVAALVEQDGAVSVARLPHLPGPACLGGQAAWSLVQIVLDDLAETTRFDHPPDCLGPQALFDKVRLVPAGVVDAKNWVEATLAAHTEAPHPEAPEQPHRPHRSTWGYRFFQTHKVDRFVRKTFRPGEDAGGFLQGASMLGPISHFVAGAAEVLLMEPIVPRRPNWEDDVRGVAKTFAAYKTALRQERGARRASLAAYVLAGGQERARKAIFRDLARWADLVVDTASDGPRARFLEHIVSTGRSGTPELVE